MSSLREIREQYGSLMKDEDKENLKKMGEIYFSSIDVDKFQPTTEEDYQNIQPVEIEDLEFLKIKTAITSGLLLEDLDEEEKKIFLKYSRKD